MYVVYPSAGDLPMRGAGPRPLAAHRRRTGSRITVEGMQGLIFNGEACLEAWRRAHPGVRVERSLGELGDDSPW